MRRASRRGMKGGRMGWTSSEEIGRSKGRWETEKWPSECYGATMMLLGITLRRLRLLRLTEGE